MLTTTECRDKLAEMEGWRKLTYGGHYCNKTKRWLYCDEGPVWTKDQSGRSFLESCQQYHPIGSDLTAAAAAMPEGWTWAREYLAPKHDPEMGLVLMWTAFHEVHGTVCTDDTGDEIADRFNLALLAREKGKNDAAG